MVTRVAPLQPSVPSEPCQRIPESEVFPELNEIAEEKGEAQVRTRIKSIRKNVHRFREVWFDIIRIPVLGAPLTREQAVSRVEKASM